MIATRHRARAGALALMLAVITGLAVLSTGEAAAGNCTKKTVTIAGFKKTFEFCGRAVNKTTETMRIARIVDRGTNGAKPCTVENWWDNNPVSKDWRCLTREVQAGKSSPSSGVWRDVDAITFSRTFTVNGVEHKAGRWVKVRDGAFVACINPHVWNWGTTPKCAIIA